MERLAHICTSERTADQLSLADLPGEIRVWTAGDDASIDTVVAGAEEIVLWFEHGLPDQLALVRLLSRASRRGITAQLTIVSIDRHPDMPVYTGFAQLGPEQLAALWPARVPIARDAIEEAVTAWVALSADDPRALPFLFRRVKALPFLAGAIERHLEELPDPSSGMSRTERQLLAAVARGAGSSALLGEIHAIDPRYPISEAALLAALQTLGNAGFVELNTDATKLAASEPAITALGRQALAGAIDRVHEVGIDAQRGGVRLSGRGPVWRWDGRERKLFER
jgi:hypothetical protein